MRGLLAVFIACLTIQLSPVAIYAQDARKKDIIKLSCSMGESTFVVNVDCASCTVNGLPANINDDTITWDRGNNIRMTINRYSGEISQSLDLNLPPVHNAAEAQAAMDIMKFQMSVVAKSGKCHEVSKKKF